MSFTVNRVFSQVTIDKEIRYQSRTPEELKGGRAEVRMGLDTFRGWPGLNRFLNSLVKVIYKPRPALDDTKPIEINDLLQSVVIEKKNGLGEGHTYNIVTLILKNKGRLIFVDGEKDDLGMYPGADAIGLIKSVKLPEFVL